MASSDDQCRNIRVVAFVAVVISTVAACTAVITLPMLYQYVQNFQSHLQDEVSYCKVN